MSRPTFATVRNRTALTIAAASAAAALGAQQTDAAIIYTPANETVNAANTFGNIDFDHDSATDVAVTYNATSGLAFSKQAENFPGYAADTASLSTVKALSAGDTIDGSLSFSPMSTISMPPTSLDGTLNDGAGTGDFTAAAGEKYIGFSFGANPSNPTPVYGWISFRVDDDSSLANLSGTITGYAFDNSGAPVPAGAIPEPSSLALLAMGATALAAYRRRSR